jgi:hypothetical protein
VDVPPEQIHELDWWEAVVLRGGELGAPISGADAAAGAAP